MVLTLGELSLPPDIFLIYACAYPRFNFIADHCPVIKSYNTMKILIYETPNAQKIINTHSLPSIKQIRSMIKNSHESIA